MKAGNVLNLCSMFFWGLLQLLCSCSQLSAAVGYLCGGRAWYMVTKQAWIVVELFMWGGVGVVGFCTVGLTQSTQKD